MTNSEIGKRINKYEKRVDKGIEWLNKNKPGWYKKINLKALDLGDGDVCILGQAFKDYWNVVRSSYDEEENSTLKKLPKLTDSQSRSMGFSDDSSDNNGENIDGYDLLTAIWYEKIQCLRS